MSVDGPRTVRGRLYKCYFRTRSIEIIKVRPVLRGCLPGPAARVFRVPRKVAAAVSLSSNLVHYFPQVAVYCTCRSPRTVRGFWSVRPSVAPAGASVCPSAAAAGGPSVRPRRNDCITMAELSKMLKTLANADAQKEAKKAEQAAKKRKK